MRALCLPLTMRELSTARLFSFVFLIAILSIGMPSIASREELSRQKNPVAPLTANEIVHRAMEHMGMRAAESPEKGTFPRRLSIGSQVPVQSVQLVGNQAAYFR